MALTQEGSLTEEEVRARWTEEPSAPEEQVEQVVRFLVAVGDCSHVEAAERLGDGTEARVRRWREGDIRPLRRRSTRDALRRYNERRGAPGVPLDAARRLALIRKIADPSAELDALAEFLDEISETESNGDGGP